MPSHNLFSDTILDTYFFVKLLIIEVDTVTMVVEASNNDDETRYTNVKLKVGSNIVSLKEIPPHFKSSCSL